MKINQIEKLSKMDRSRIRFYEREGFITPERSDNGYRDYSDEDLQILLRIKLLRSLHISIDDIKELIGESKDLQNTLSEQIVKLEDEKQDVSYAQEVCRDICEDKVSFENLDAKKYLDNIDKTMNKTSSLYFSVKEDEILQVFHPWRRYLARMLDISLYGIFWSAFMAFVFHVNILRRSYLGTIFDSFISIAMMLFLEPIWLTLLGTTPGKAIFGLRIENDNGEFLSYSEGFERTWSVIAYGMGYNIPVYSFICLWKSYNICNEKEIQRWDESIYYTIKDTKWYRQVLYIGSNLAMLAFLAIIILAQRIPPNRGELTVDEFVENHNYYSDLFGIGFGTYHLAEDGKWTEKEFYGNSHYEISYTGHPEYHFILEDEKITGISFVFKIEKNENFLLIGDYDIYMVLSSLSFICAQEEIGLFSNIQSRISDQIQNNRFDDFQFTEAGIKVICDVEYEGFTDTETGFLFAEENVSENYFKLEFSMNKNK